MSDQQILLADEKIKELSRKGAIQKTKSAQEEFLSNLFLERKKDELNFSVISLYNTMGNTRF